MTRKTKVEDQVLFQIKRRKERIFHTSCVTNVVTMDIVPVNVIIQTKESMKPPLLILMKTLHIRSQEMMILKKVQKIVERSSSPSILHVDMMR